MHSELFIDGAWTASDSEELIEVIDPATEEVVSHIAAGNEADINRAVIAAKGAFEGPWRKTSGADRAVYLRRIAKAIEDNKEKLARLEVMDNGKPLPEALWDIEDAAGCFEYYAGLAEGLDAKQGERIAVSHDDFVSRVFYEPIGVCGLIIPWNYPLLMAAWKVAPAIAAGCTCVLKPSEVTSLTALELADIVDQSVDLPRGVFNLVTGTGAAAGAPLATHPDVSKLAFTGSVPTGGTVMGAAAQSIKNVSLELGGKSPIIVFNDADIERAVEWIMFGIFWNQGEVCSATSRLLVEDAIAPHLLKRLKEEAEKIKIGHGTDEGVLLGPLVSQQQYDKVSRYIKAGKDAGATLLTGGGRPPHLDRGYFLQPTIFTDVDTDSSIWREEIFGPVLCVRTFSSEEEATALANDTPFGLAAAIVSADETRLERVARALDAGIVWLNCSQPTFTEAPWGGMKKSGIGRELGEWGLNNYLEVKQVTAYMSEKPWGWYTDT